MLVYLAKPIERYRYTGEKNYSGSGKSRVASPIVAPISSYDSVPNIKKAVPKSSASVRLEKDGAYLAPYWNEFASYSRYEVEIDGEFDRLLLKSHTGDRTVGAAIHGKVGALLFLPPLRYDDEEFEREAEGDEEEFETYWTDDALKFGKRLVTALVALADSFKKTGLGTPPPSWTKKSEYRVASESALEAAILKCAAEMASLQTEKERLEAELEGVGELRRLFLSRESPLKAQSSSRWSHLALMGRPSQMASLN